MKPLFETFLELRTIAGTLDEKSLSASTDEALINYQEHKFIVAAVGEFKRGKSSLLNSILEKPLFPVGVLPLTSVITMAEFGEDEKAVVYFHDGTSRQIDGSAVADYVTEEGNRSNELNVRAALLEINSPLLSSGMRLVDTPGIGSIISENSAVAKQFIPHIDVALAVLGYEPPITGEELELLRKLQQEASRIIVILNKNDLPGVKAREAIEKFTEVSLKKNGIIADEIISVCSLTQSGHNPDEGVARLTRILAGLSEKSSESIIKESARKSIRRIASALFQVVELRIFSLLEPAATIEKKLKDFNDEVADLDIWVTAAKTKAEKKFKIDEKPKIRR